MGIYQTYLTCHIHVTDRTLIVDNMGDCCGFCCGYKEEQKPLLGHSDPVRPTTVRTGSSSPATPITTEPTTSARLYNPHQDSSEFEKSIKLIAPTHLEFIPIPAIDKTFQDISRLYNEIVGNHKSLETDIHKFKEYFLAETAGIPVLKDCVKILVQRAGGAEIRLERRSKQSIELFYDKQEVAKCCQGEAERVIEPLNYFSNALRHIREILSHAPQVESNVKIIISDEERLRKEIMKADLETAVMQQGLKIFMDNVSKLKAVVSGTDTIKRDVEKKFIEFSKACEGFFQVGGS